MHAFIEAAFDRGRTAILILMFVIIAGAASYINIPKESDPDVAIPIIYVSMSHEGISPDDAERLLVRPMEKELQSIEGIKEMRGTATEGQGSVLLEFDAGFDAQKALSDVREKVDVAKSQLPGDTDEPTVNEVNVALFPVLTVSLSGPLPERGLLKVAKSLKDRIEALPGVLEVDVGGDRAEVMEVTVNPIIMETYGVRYEELFSLIQRNNLLVAAGALDTGNGRLVLKVPGVIENIEDVLRLPVKVDGDTVVTFGDVASVSRTFKDPQGFARVDGQHSIALEIKKRIGTNIIETIEEVRALVVAESEHWPASIQIGYMQDQSEDIREILGDLQNNVLSAVILVMIVIIAILGVRSSLLVGLAIPGSFLTGILALDLMGHTLNIVTLFSLILVVGMLVDGAIVVTELADRKLSEGLNKKEAYGFAAKRMCWPVIASTATTLAVFMPLMFWPGVIGQFMKFLPLTVMVCLGASLFMALIFIPVLGGNFGKRNPDKNLQQTMLAAESGDLQIIGGFTGGYISVLRGFLRFPALTLLLALTAIVLTYMAYAKYNHGTEFFPDVESKFAQVQIHTRGDLSIYEKGRVVRKVEQRILGMDELRVVYARTFNFGSGNNRAEDVIGVIQLEFIDWQARRKGSVILEEIRQRTADIAGILIEVRKQENGPSEGKPIKLQLSSRQVEKLAPAAAKIRAEMDRIGGFVDVEDSRALAGVEWRLLVNRELAARYGADVSLLGNAVRMVTNGINLATYRPDDTDEELDIRVRFPFGERNLDKLSQLRVPSSRGMIPISNFVTLEPAPKTGTLNRVDAQRVITVQADVAEGLLVDEKVKELRANLENLFDPEILIQFKGEDEEQRKTGAFLAKAFSVAIFLMTLILVTQFNSLYQAVMVLSAIIFSTAGVLMGLLISGQPFGTVMVGIGIIALAGIVVNNNIVLIDTYNGLKSAGLEAFDAALRTGAQRMRPVLLTAVTTVLGLLPMVLSMNIDLLNRSVSFGAPSTQWWTQLATAIAGGLSFATVLTLILTPCLLVLGDKLFGGKKKPVLVKENPQAQPTTDLTG